MKNEEKRHTIGECLQKAEKYISEKGICLFIFDVKDSKKSKDRKRLQERLFSMRDDLNKNFAEYLPENRLLKGIIKSKGFEIVAGDAACAGINSSYSVDEIIKYLTRNYKDIELNFGIARDCYDKQGMSVAF